MEKTEKQLIQNNIKAAWITETLVVDYQTGGLLLSFIDIIFILCVLSVQCSPNNVGLSDMPDLKAEVSDVMRLVILSCVNYR